MLGDTTKGGKMDSTVFLHPFQQSDQDDRMVITKGCVHWNPVYGWEDSCLKWSLNPGLLHVDQ